jgi:hypothetical protein
LIALWLIRLATLLVKLVRSPIAVQLSRHPRIPGNSPQLVQVRQTVTTMPLKDVSRGIVLAAFSTNSLEVDDSEQQPADLPTLPKKRKAAVGSGWVNRKPKKADRRPIEERKKEEEVQHRLSELDVTDEKEK